MANAVIEGIRERVTAAVQVYPSVGIQVPENRHANLLEAIFNSMCKNTHDLWTFVAASKTFNYIHKEYKEVDQFPNIRFIDCISRTAGIVERQPSCIYLESPGMLERLVLEILTTFRGSSQEVEKFVVLDSLSALLVYNDPEIIREFITLLMNRTRSENIHVISILVEEEMDSNKLIQLNDKIIVLRDSFID